VKETVWICPRAEACNREGVGRYCRCAEPHHAEGKCALSGDGKSAGMKADWCPDCVELPNIVMVEEEKCLIPKS